MKAINVKWLLKSCNVRAVNGGILRAGDVGEVSEGNLTGLTPGQDYEEIKPNPKAKAKPKAKAEPTTEEES